MTYLKSALCTVIFGGALLATPLAASEKTPKPATLCPNGSKLDASTGKCEEFIHDM